MTTPATTAAPPASADAHDAVVLTRVSKLYGDVAAVDDLTLTVRRGEFLSLLGPSGCGKTTTLRMIAGFEHPDTGDILVDGRSVLGVPPHRRQVNTVFQAYALFPHMSVAENVAYGLEQKRTPKAEIRGQVAEALDMVQMRGYANRRPTQLSGGQQQRVALARALVNRPSVLLLDEPLGALDRQLREEMQVELKLLQSRLGISFVFVTHDQGEALSMSDRIAIMREGRVEQLGDADAIYSTPVSAYVAGFVGQQNFLDGRVADAGAVETDLGPVRSTRGAPVRPGERVRVAVRPELVRLSSSEPDGTSENRVRGTVIGVAHQGETRQFLVDAGRGHTLLVRVPTPAAPRLGVGDPAWCRWETDDVHLFPHDGEHSAPPPTSVPDGHAG
ncbi:ABC transporter ATP-binding protein [Phycicoccus sp. MAQZ13P-2]|uniref:ABC transporter ATP-binding protein n=1 Tax=Phycicoccus mangrovi TaxID=2840470 RepID=UPI001C004D83|nr:ABC transporter ATP-binding protein [Phycicoccus mangrovi]MBT9257884.1 ABC transporter ATP-binding protein [Phycicoccus mangrovi]MBT9272887.1 ABC transporter ATP-binding protein [Phycicoccus mangrovi]